MEHIDAEERGFVMSQEPYALAVREVEVRRESGHDVAALAARLAATDPDDAAALREVHRAAEQLPAPAGWPHAETSDLAEVLALLPAPTPASRPRPTGAELADRIHGAWLGRVAGNMLGKPVEIPEHWDRARLRGYLQDRGAYPLRDYLPLPEGTDDDAAEALGFRDHRGATRGRISGSVRDDDVDFTLVGLHLLETRGPAFTTEDVLRVWLARLPLHQTFTAERAAYANAVRGVPLERLADVDNPYREWIGALIRADVFGYVHPGDPRSAAVAAHRDAVLSHRANGVYGAMWAAALIALGFTAGSAREAVELSLEHVPPTSRLAAAVRAVLDDHAAGLGWEEAFDRVEERHAGLSWVHVVNNAAMITAGVLWGDGDVDATLGLTVQGGLDTDSAGATAGSFVGALRGAAAVPARWTDPLEDRVRSAVLGFGESRISDLAARTTALVRPPRG